LALRGRSYRPRLRPMSACNRRHRNGRLPPAAMEGRQWYHWLRRDLRKVSLEAGRTSQQLSAPLAPHLYEPPRQALPRLAPLVQACLLPFVRAVALFQPTPRRLPLCPWRAIQPTQHAHHPKPHPAPGNNEWIICAAIAIPDFQGLLGGPDPWQWTTNDRLRRRIQCPLGSDRPHRGAQYPNPRRTLKHRLASVRSNRVAADLRPQ
jgi:hypothetical protein